MADDKEKSPLISMSVVAVILAALGVTIFVQPFKGSRPPVSEYRESFRKISARLWQDPFQAVLDGVKADQTISKGIGEVDIGGGPCAPVVPEKSAFLMKIEHIEKGGGYSPGFHGPGWALFRRHGKQDALEVCTPRRAQQGGVC